MEPVMVLSLLSFAMLVGCYSAGSIPLVMTMSEVGQFWLLLEDLAVFCTVMCMVRVVWWCDSVSFVGNKGLMLTPLSRSSVTHRGSRSLCAPSDKKWFIFLLLSTFIYCSSRSICSVSFHFLRKANKLGKKEIIGVVYTANSMILCLMSQYAGTFFIIAKL